MSRVRIKFTLSMPRNNSWNGKWSGRGRGAANHYAIVRETSQMQADTLAMLHGMRWSYSFGDGWVAAISGRLMLKGERLKSQGFCGYDWMVDSILHYGVILNDERDYDKKPVFK